MKVAKKMKIPIVGTNHFMPENVFYHFHLPKIFESALKKLGWKHLHSIYKQMAAVTTPSETAAKFLRKSGFPNAVEVISNGIDLKKFNPKYKTEYLRKKYNLGDKKIILYVGRLDPEKNVTDLVEAMPDILKKTNAHLIIIGRGACDKIIEKTVSELNLENNVTITGYIPDKDLPAFFCLANCFVLPGTAELQGIVIMEAMASRCPVIGANAIALPELIHDGKNGYLYPPRNIKALATKLKKILSNNRLREKMAKKSLELISAHDIRKTTKKFVSIYKRVIRKSK